MDTGATGAAGGRDPTLATVGEIHRPTSPEGKARAARNADKGGEWRETRALIRELNQLMRQQQEALGEVERIIAMKRP
jgi:hypothetical protein